MGSGIGHSKGLKQNVCKRIICGLVTDGLNQSRRQFAGIPVHPVRTGLKCQDGLGQCPDFFPEPVGALVPQRGQAGGHASFGKVFTVLHGRETVGEAAGHGHYVLYQDGTVRGNCPLCSVRIPDYLFAGFPLRKIFGDGIVHDQKAALVEHHQGGVEGQLGHRCHAENIGGRHFRCV